MYEFSGRAVAVAQRALDADGRPRDEAHRARLTQIVRVLAEQAGRVRVRHDAVDADGRISDSDTRARLRDAFTTILAEVHP